MEEHETLERVAENYRAQGFDVLLHPTPEEMPAFLANAPVEMLARKGDHLVALRRNDEQDTRELAGDLGAKSGWSALGEAQRLLTPQTARAALLMAWAAFEAAARTLLHPGKTAFDKTTSRQMIEQLFSEGQIDEEEHSLLLGCLFLRNAVAHGILPLHFPLESVSLLLGVARRLLLKTSEDSAPREFDSVALVGGGSTFVMVSHRGAMHNPDLMPKIDAATKYLLDILGPSRGKVYIEWDPAQSADGRAAIVLKLSDLHGAITATFLPSEFEDDAGVRERLTRLWGDLLEIRSHEQLKQLLAPAGT